LGFSERQRHIFDACDVPPQRLDAGIVCSEQQVAKPSGAMSHQNHAAAQSFLRFFATQTKNNRG
jgi:hypothetical protein